MSAATQPTPQQIEQVSGALTFGRFRRFHPSDDGVSQILLNGVVVGRLTAEMMMVSGFAGGREIYHVSGYLAELYTDDGRDLAAKSFRVRNHKRQIVCEPGRARKMARDWVALQLARVEQ